MLPRLAPLDHMQLIMSPNNILLFKMKQLLIIGRSLYRFKYKATLSLLMDTLEKTLDLYLGIDIT